jgi:NADPH2:quinone reductase
MRAVRLDAVGPAENLKVVEKPVPVPGPDEVLIKVELAGLIFGDIEARRGTYFTETRTPWFPGREAAGYIVAVGGNVRDFTAGERVAALVLSLGCCAEFVVASTKPQTLAGNYQVPPADIIKLPDNVSFAQALVYLVNFRLAHLLFHGSSRVPRGTVIVVQGAAGGMGSMLTQLAHAHGCPVIATCRRATEESYLKQLGATHVVNVIHTDYVASVRELTQGRGVRFVFNGVGGDTLAADADIVAPFGEIQAYGYVAGKKPLDLFRVRHSIAIKTFIADDFFATPMFPAATAAMHEWFGSGPLLEATVVLPLDEVVEANRLLERGEVLGKIALRP